MYKNEIHFHIYIWEIHFLYLYLTKSNSIKNEPKNTCIFDVLNNASEIFVWTLDPLKRSCRKEHFALHLVYIREDTCKCKYFILCLLLACVCVLEWIF